MARMYFACFLCIFAFFTSSDINAFYLALPLFLICLYFLKKIENTDFCAQDMFWFCVLIYFVIVPVQLFDGGYFLGAGPTSGLFFEYKSFAKGQLVVVFFVLSLYFFMFSLPVLRGDLKKNNINFDLASRARLHAAVLIFSVVGSMGYIILVGGVAVVLSPRNEFNFEETSAFAFLFLAFLVAGNLCSLNAFKSGAPKFSWKYFVFIFCVILQIFCINPFNQPRFFIIAAWLPFFMMSFKFIRRPDFMYSALFVALIVVMPVMSISSRSGASAVNLTEIFDGDIFLIRDVDIFETLVYMFDYVGRVGYDFGLNLLSIFLFFVPRGMWLDKPLVGGLYVGSDLFALKVAGTDNLSFFIGGDFYLAFGFFGVIFGGALVGALLRWMDYLLISFGGDEIQRLIYIGVLPILIRGPVGAVLGFPLCLFVCLLFYKFISNKSYILRR